MMPGPDDQTASQEEKSTDFAITIDGDPVAKARARKGGANRHYTPKKTRSYEAWVQQHARWAMKDRQRIRTPVEVRIEFRLAVPRSWPLWKQQAALLGYVKPSGRPDIDNFIKSILDGFNAIVWKDDGQVYAVDVTKMYAERAYVFVKVKPRPDVGSADQWRAMVAEGVVYG